MSHVKNHPFWVLAFLGYLYGAVTFLTCACNSSVNFSRSHEEKAGDKTTKAFTTYRVKSIVSN